MDRLKSFEGIPHPYDRKKRMVVPSALKVLRLKLHRRFCMLGDLSTQVGWKCQDLLKRLEAKRKVRSGAYYQKKKASIRAKSDALKKVKPDKDTQQTLSAAGYGEAGGRGFEAIEDRA